jgi:selenocysteine lyase/cysteine desulfurase
MSCTRREFARLLALGGSAVLVPRTTRGWERGDLAQANGEALWTRVRAEFSMPDNLVMLNAANLCPSSRRVTEVLLGGTRDIDQDPSPANRSKFGDGREATRKLIAASLRVSPEEVILTRNTSEANNLVSSGLDLKAGDEILILADNHPSNNNAWKEKAKRFGYVVTAVGQPNPHPGTEYYLDAVKKAITPRTRVLALTHVTSTVGDLVPVTELCRLAREHGVLTLVDGAQSFGILDVDLSAIQPDCYSASGHKWPCGPRETGVLYVSKGVQARLSPHIVSLYAGAVGASRTLEAYGQRDEPAMVALGEAVKLQQEAGAARIEARGRELSAALMEGLRRIDGVKIWTSADPGRFAAIVSFQPASLDVRKLSAALYDKERIVCATRGGADRGGLRFSPHFYNSHAEIDRAVAAIAKYLRAGV